MIDRTKHWQNETVAERIIAETMCSLGTILNYEGEPASSNVAESVADSGSPSKATGEPVGKRGKPWLAWEDRALAKQVLADDPILNKTGSREDRWREVSNHLQQVNMTRSWASCKNRMDLLVEWHRKESTRSKQKTGEVEEVNEHIRNMDYIILLFDSVSNNNEIRRQARDKIAKRKEKGKQVMLASVQGQVRKRDLMEVLGRAEDIGQKSSSPRKRTRAAKNQLAKEVEVVLEGLQERSETFRKAIEEREARDKEKAEREKEIHETQKDINAKLDALLGTMNMFLQQSLTNVGADKSRE